MATVELIPPDEVRTWVLDALQDLVSTCGFEHLVCAPMLLPQPRYFPDHWSPDADGVRRLALRFLRYAGQDALDVEVEMFDNRPEDAPSLGPLDRKRAHEGAAAWFAGIDDGVCLFGASVGLLDDPGGVTAALAHETGHVFRHMLDLVVRDRDLEECLTDLSTTYLGFGVLTTNASERHRSWVLQATGSSLGGHAWSTSQLGYLSPQTMSFALAVVERVRQRGRSERRAILNALESNQAGFFRAAQRWLNRNFDDANALRERLGIPEPSQWPEPDGLEDLLAAPLDDHDDHAHAHDDDDFYAAAVDAGDDESSAVDSDTVGTGTTSHPVHLVPMRPNPLFGLVIAIGGLIASIPLFERNLELPAIAVIMMGLVLAYHLPRKLPRYECSACNGLLTRKQSRCASCNGTVAGTLARAEDRRELPDT